MVSVAAQPLWRRVSARVPTFTLNKKKPTAVGHRSVACDDIVGMSAREAQISSRNSERRYLWRFLPFGHDPLMLKHQVRDASECVQRQAQLKPLVSQASGQCCGARRFEDFSSWHDLLLTRLTDHRERPGALEMVLG